MLDIQGGTQLADQFYGSAENTLPKIAPLLSVLQNDAIHGTLNDAGQMSLSQVHQVLRRGANGYVEMCHGRDLISSNMAVGRRIVSAEDPRPAEGLSMAPLGLRAMH